MYKIYKFKEIHCGEMNSFSINKYRSYKCKFVLCINAIKSYFQPFYILAINNSFMVVVYIGVYAKINFLDCNYSITIHMLGKLDRAFINGVADGN